MKLVKTGEVQSFLRKKELELKKSARQAKAEASQPSPTSKFSESAAAATRTARTRYTPPERKIYTDIETKLSQAWQTL